MTGKVFITLGGPTLKIKIGSEVHTFEDHPYCGPIRVQPNGNEAKSQPMRFLVAVSKWAQQGRQIEDGFCKWNESIPLK